MARPKIPLISRQKALAAALGIIDDEGLDSLSIRRLADELGVNGASLYHHFKNKEEIVLGAAELALVGVATSPGTDENWRTWLPRNSGLVRQAMLDHPELIPVIIRNGGLGMGSEPMESVALRLIEEGVPLGAVAPLMDALETFAIGSAIHEARGDSYAAPALAASSPLVKAGKSSALSATEVYEIASGAIVDAVHAAAEAKAAGPRRVSARRAAAATDHSAATSRSAVTPAIPRTAKGTAASPKTGKQSGVKASPATAAKKPVPPKTKRSRPA